MHKGFKVILNENNEIDIGGELLGLADWKAGAHISAQYTEQTGSLILQNLANVFSIKESGSIAITENLLKETALQKNNEYTAFYDKSNNSIVVHLSPKTCTLCEDMPGNIKLKDGKTICETCHAILQRKYGTV